MKWMFLPFKRYTDFSGRSRRTEFWLFALFLVICAHLVSLPFFGLMTKAMMQISPSDLQELAEEQAQPETLKEAFMMPFRIFGFIFQEIPRGPLIASLSLMGLFWLATVVPTLALNVRRFHDCNIASAWFWVCFVSGLIPFLGGIGSLVMIVIVGFVPGTKGENRFGENPRDAEDEAPLAPGDTVPPPPKIWPAS